MSGIWFMEPFSSKVVGMPGAAVAGSALATLQIAAVLKKSLRFIRRCTWPGFERR